MSEAVAPISVVGPAMRVGAAVVTPAAASEPSQPVVDSDCRPIESDSKSLMCFAVGSAAAVVVAADGGVDGNWCLRLRSDLL